MPYNLFILFTSTHLEFPRPYQTSGIALGPLRFLIIPLLLISSLSFADGRADIIVSGAAGTFTLEVSQDGPTLAIRDPERAKQRGRAHKYKAVIGLEKNGQLRGWFVEKKGPTPADDSLVWFPARKKRPTKKRTTKP